MDVIKAKCETCGTEHTVFDSRCHGYDALTDEKRPREIEYHPRMKQKGKNALRIALKITNDASLDEFMENTGELYDEEFYSNAFGSIAIYVIDDNGKKKRIFAAETA